MHNIIRWGLIGPGKIAHRFAEAIKVVDGAQLYAIASRSAESARAFAAQYNAPVYYESYEALVKDPQVDIVYIATPHAFHAAHTILCLENKKAVLCEKPLAHTLKDVKKMIEASAAHQTFLMEAMWSRFLPTVEKALELIASGAIGEVKIIRADFGFRSEYNPQSRLFDLQLGGGSLLDVGVYPLFLALAVLGKPSEIKSMAQLAPGGADESCHVLLRYPGATANLYSTILTDTHKQAEICGTKGRIILNAPWYRPTTLTWVKEDGTQEQLSFNFPGNGFDFEIQEAMNCLRTGKIESRKMPHYFSLLQSTVLDEICKQCGIQY